MRREGYIVKGVLSRVLIDGSGRLRMERLFPTLFGLVLLALLGTVLLVATPVLKDHELIQGLWVLTCVFLLKMPLVVVLWWLIWRNQELPGRPVDWSRDEFAGILEHLLRQARTAFMTADEDARLAYLSKEAWNLADQVSGDATVDALTVALRIDERRVQLREQGADARAR